MPRYIDADKVLDTMRSVMDMQELYLPTHFIDLVINEMQSADVEPVRHGRWIDQNGDYVCSVCGWKFSDELPYMARKRDAKTEDIMRYCLHCGAELELKWGDEE